jgi:hypothetical protein
MKLLTIISLMLLSLNLSATDIFTLDNERLNSEIAEVSALETLLEEYPTINFNELEKNQIFDLNNFDSKKANVASGIGSNMQWGYFAWGFCCYPVGIFVLIFSDSQNVDDYQSFVIGAAVSCVLSAISYGFLYFFVLTQMSTIY